MVEDDVQLIRRILLGDNEAFRCFGPKTPEGGSRACMAEGWGFSLC